VVRDDDDVRPPDRIEAPLRDEQRADPLALVSGNHRQRGEGNGLDPTTRRDDRKVGEEDVADDPISDLGDQRRPVETAVTRGFVVSAEGEPVDVP
jgi:hypothetical protein